MKVEPFKYQRNQYKEDEKQLSHFFPRTNTNSLNKTSVSLSIDNRRKTASDQISKNKGNHFPVAKLKTIVILNVHCSSTLLRKAKYLCYHWFDTNV